MLLTLARTENADKRFKTIKAGTEFHVFVGWLLCTVKIQELR